MEIAIFNKITTDGVITSIEENSKKYHVGFYADMNNAPERKLVKESASEIGGIIKELEAARISITKANTLAVNKEHKSILERLTVANAPFQTLIDEYTAQRKKILADEKRVAELRAAMVQKEDDHEMGLLINKTFEYDKAEELRLKEDHDKAYRDQVEAEAEERANSKAAHAKAASIREGSARLANKSHVGNVNRGVLRDLMYLGLTEADGKALIRAIFKNEISNITINY